ncbi:hypothetical protein GMDG_04758 [Pseudogymnoascus destructans 20631-21]|uniref:Uncharacterized protein n=1 Tax=Pseudogymnoascus destructans (strain ATCC MYA-4855 / 20631-21) TaxID=658429 RepID=L8GBL8_PSED2|nr:hypothetical protein GMDG_04758 [Pseudogymnoascus destructans 20631-21]
MPVPPPAGALSVTFCILCLRCLRAKARGLQAHACVWSPSSSKCEYCTGQHSPCISLPWFLDEEYRALVAAEAALPVIAANVVAAATEANRVALAHATRAAIEAGFTQIRSSLRRLRTEQGGVPALLEEVVAAVGKLPAVTATAATVPVRAGRRKEGEGEGEGTFGGEYGE